MAKSIIAALALAALPVLADGTEDRTVNLDVAKGGALGGLVTAATAYLYSIRRQRMQVSPDPLNVKGVPASVKGPTCEAIHKGVDEHLSKNQKDHDDIFPRLALVEQRVAVLEGTIAEIRSEYKSIDDKLTVLLRRK